MIEKPMDNNSPVSAAEQSPTSAAQTQNDAESPCRANSEVSGTSDAKIDPDALRQKIIQVLHTVYDPEIPVDIWELGLVYQLSVTEDGDVYIQMTLTSPMCPVAGSLPPEVEAKVRGVEGVRNVRVELTWEPPWNMAMMSEAARLKLGFM